MELIIRCPIEGCNDGDKSEKTHKGADQWRCCHARDGDGGVASEGPKRDTEIEPGNVHSRGCSFYAARAIGRDL